MQFFNKLALMGMLAAGLISCDNVKQKTKETINKGGELTGETATEFFEGVSEGVDKTLQPRLELSASLAERGLKTGKISVEDQQEGGTNNLLTVYLIFEKDFKGPVVAKAFDKNDLEIGRTKLDISGKAGNAAYVDFTFDKRTDIEPKSKIILEQGE